MPKLFADIILPLPLPGDFTYRVPENLQGKAQAGRRVIVQFGKRKYYSGLIKKIHRESPEGCEIKAIEEVLDEHPVIHPLQFEFWQWMAGYYMCSMGEVLKAALPSGLKLESRTRVIFNPNFEATEPFSSREDAVFNFLSDVKMATIQDVNHLLPSNNGFQIVKSLLARKAIFVEESLKESYKPKTESYLQLSDAYRPEAQLNAALDNLKRAPKQQQVLTELVHRLQNDAAEKQPEIRKGDLTKTIEGATPAINALRKKGIITIVEKKIDRLTSFEGDTRPPHALNNHQQKAFESIRQQLNQHPVVLLHGVTSSGKTEVYIHLIKQYLDAGMQVLYLLPEIALTSQITHRLQSVFGDKTGIYHSKFNDQERVEIWNKVLHFDGEKKQGHQLILGARSAVFLPFSKLGLIVVDEEHENTYKQFDPAPRYNARDAAIVLGHLTGAKTVLGTATPSVESYYNAQNGKYGLVELATRHKNIALPEIVVADMREAYRKKLMRSHFTPELFEAIEKALENKEQVILFQNRRGFSPFLQCTGCGWVPQCEHCDVSLTYHKHSAKLSCHYCGYNIMLPPQCPDCFSEEIKTKGFGTEKIEEDISLLFPESRVLRMDTDTTRAKKGYEKIIASFEKGGIDILVGTQMITKGLDFANVNIVGILNADNLLNFPDFRSFERSFQLMSQVSGRAGRTHKRGKVIIQTSSPGHPVITDVLNNDFRHMYETQLQERKLFRYPPYYRLLTITLKHKNREQLDTASEQLATELKKTFGTRVLGPEYPAINRIQQWYHKIIWLKMEKKYAPSAIKATILKKMELVKNFPKNGSLIIIPDVDPQ